MIIEISKSDHAWFRDFLTNYMYLMNTHVLNGTKMGDSVKENITEIISLAPKKGESYLVPIEDEHLEFFIEILEECTCACPNCCLSSVRHRQNIKNKLWRLMEIGE